MKKTKMLIDKGYKIGKIAPYHHVSLYGIGVVLHLIITTPKYDSKDFTDVPYIEPIVVYNEENGEETIIAVNRDFKKNMLLECGFRSFKNYDLIEHFISECNDLKAYNTLDNQPVTPSDKGKSKVDAGRLELLLAKPHRMLYGLELKKIRRV